MKSFAPLALSLVALGGLVEFRAQDGRYREPTLIPGDACDVRFSEVMRIPIERNLTGDHVLQALGCV